MAKKLCLNVNDKVPEEVYKLMEFYPQPMMQRHPGVEFVPTPQRKSSD